jgi:L-ascorbate metabolism protein UlaG (beta-lactamase superfamily)
MIIQRMQWAGLVVTIQEIRIMVDPIYDSPSASFFGAAREPFYPLSDFERPDAIAITHLHSDHFDAKGILKSFGEDISIFVPHGAVSETKEKGLRNVKGLAVGESAKIKHVDLIAAPSVDGLGDSQVAWVIKGAEETFLHCGDTLWHGYWWKLRRDYGPFDVVCLPINGAIVQEEGLTPSEQPICMGPEQAASAATILEANTLIPIHFGGFHNPPIYLETPHVLERLKTALTKTDIKLVVLNNKDELKVEGN